MSDAVKDKKNLVKNVHLAIGVDFLGSKTSFQSGRNYEIEATAIGVKIVSNSSGRTVIIPYPNVKGMEMLQEGVVADGGRLSAANRAKQGLEEARSKVSKQELAAAKAAEAVAGPLLSQEELMEQAAEARTNARKLARDQAAAKLAADKAKGL